MPSWGAGQHCRHRTGPSSFATFTASPGPRGAHTAQARLLRGRLTAEGAAGQGRGPGRHPRGCAWQPLGRAPPLCTSLAAQAPSPLGGAVSSPAALGRVPALQPPPWVTGLTLRLASSRPLLLLSLSTERGSAGGALRVKHRADPHSGRGRRHGQLPGFLARVVPEDGCSRQC